MAQESIRMALKISYICRVYIITSRGRSGNVIDNFKNFMMEFRSMKKE